jgi:hypothetical protein
MPQTKIDQFCSRQLFGEKAYLDTLTSQIAVWDESGDFCGAFLDVVRAHRTVFCPKYRYKVWESKAEVILPIWRLLLIFEV